MGILNNYQYISYHLDSNKSEKKNGFSLLQVHLLIPSEILNLKCLEDDNYHPKYIV